MVFAAMAGGAAWMAARSEPAWVYWFMAAAGVQLRLFCNLMDGLLAVEGGLKSATGELFNEIPDRISDALILVPLGYAGASEWSIALGWAAAVGSVLTAYIRALGASMTGQHDFSGPMAKPHRMAAVTVTCFTMMILGLAKITFPLLLVSLAVINTGILITCWRRTRHLIALLNQDPNS